MREKSEGDGHTWSDQSRLEQQPGAGGDGMDLVSGQGAGRWFYQLLIDGIIIGVLVQSHNSSVETKKTEDSY